MIQVRDAQEYPDSLKFVLNLTTINEVPKVVGSASYLQHKYPGDVDVFEQVIVRGDRRMSLDYYAGQFQTIAQELVLTRREVIFNEFKAGLDDRFEYPGGENHSPDQRQMFVMGLVQQGILNVCEANDLNQFSHDWYDFAEQLRRMGALRWSLTEIIHGVKEYRRKHFMLREALAMNSIVKIDVISWIEGRFQSVEVFYDLRYQDPVTQQIEFFHDLGVYVQNLQKDLQKYGSKRFFNPLKLMKRLWSLSRIIDCEVLLEALNPLFSSNAAALNQVVADTEILGDLTRKENPPLNTMVLEALGFKKRVFNHLDLSRYQKFPELIDPFFQNWIKRYDHEKFSYKNFRERLGKIRTFLIPIITAEAGAFLREVEARGLSCPRVRPPG